MSGTLQLSYNFLYIYCTHHFSLVREALFNTLRKDVHMGQKDLEIGI
jgi:hypothetical protein